MRPNFLLIGMNHRTASVDIRERFNLADKCGPGSWVIPPLAGVNESLVLSTCNRVEILASGGEGLEGSLLGAWANACACAPDELSRYIYKHAGLEAVRHVFEVASSLDSMVVGEPQILGQLKTAYRNSVECRMAGPVINKLLHTAFFVAKRVRNETAIAANAVSISYAAVELARRIFGSLPSHRALLIGAGEMAELAAMHLLQAGIDEIIVCNRTLENGQALAARFHGRAVPFGELGETLAEADIVIASTGSREPVINAEQVGKALRARRNRPMFFIDIAVPRDVDPRVNTLDNVYLYDIDDLRDVVEENMAARRVEAEAAKAIIDEEVGRFARWLESLDAKPTIIDLISRGEKAAAIELGRAFRRLRN
ncbi:MAG: glutamyl-tRNA reductase, partial [Desulfovibrio sp.]|nr:glutamyl-tRNA reductase [Desulfovibrio sp.]